MAEKIELITPSGSADVVKLSPLRSGTDPAKTNNVIRVAYQAERAARNRRKTKKRQPCEHFAMAKISSERK